MANSVTIKGESGGAIGVGTTSPTSGTVTVDKASSGTAVDLKLSGTTVGNVGVISDRVYLTAEGSHGVYLDASANNFCPSSTTGTDNDGNIDLGASFARWKSVYVGTDIRIGGTGTANALDDYEEGTFTPAADSFSGTMTFTTANYVKIGKLVHVNFKMTSDGNSDTSQISISGFPFSAVAEHSVSLSHNMAGNGALQSNTTPTIPNAIINTAEIMYVYLPTGGAFQYAFMGTGFIRVSGTYITA